MAQDKVPPPGLNPRVAKLLLDKLETDNEFRDAFVSSPEQALRSIGHTDAAPCMALKAGQTLASPEQIKAQRAKLQDVMVGIQSQDCALTAQEGY